jgi:hypothetical protein
MTMNFRWKKIAAIYQHALEPNVPPINFFGLLGDTNFLTWRKPQRFPLRATAHKKWGHRGETAAPKSAASFGDRGKPKPAGH